MRVDCPAVRRSGCSCTTLEPTRGLNARPFGLLACHPQLQYPQLVLACPDNRQEFVECGTGGFVARGCRADQSPAGEYVHAVNLPCSRQFGDVPPLCARSHGRVMQRAGSLGGTRQARRFAWWHHMRHAGRPCMQVLAHVYRRQIRSTADADETSLQYKIQQLCSLCEGIFFVWGVRRHPCLHSGVITLLNALLTIVRSVLPGIIPEYLRRSPFGSVPVVPGPLHGRSVTVHAPETTPPPPPSAGNSRILSPQRPCKPCARKPGTTADRPRAAGVLPLAEFLLLTQRVHHVPSRAAPCLRHCTERPRVSSRPWLSRAAL